MRRGGADLSIAAELLADLRSDEADLLAAGQSRTSRADRAWIRTISFWGRATSRGMPVHIGRRRR